MAKKRASSVKINTVRINPISYYRFKGDDFLELLFDAVSDELPDSGNSSSDRWDRLSDRLKAINGWWCLVLDIENGGLSQFFYNNSDCFTAELVALLIEAGCDGVATLIDEAVSIFREHRSEFDVANPFGEDGLFATMKAFNKLENKAIPRLAKTTSILEKFVRTNVADFAVDEDGQPLNSKFTGTIELKYPNGSIREEASVKKGKLTGTYRRFFDDGTLDHATFYVAGEESADFWPNGQVKLRVQKKGPLKIYEWYFETGALQKRYVKDKDGYAVEPIRVWHPNGQLADEMVVNDFNPISRNQWFDDGSPRLEATYTTCVEDEDEDEDTQFVVRNAWDKNKNQIVKNGSGEYYDDGIDYDTEYYMERKSMWTSQYPVKNGLPHGKMTTWNEGVLWSICDHKNGIRNGKEVYYYENGRVRGVTQYKNGIAGREMDYPKFDNPRPVVRLRIRADEYLYSNWKHQLLDEYPVPKNQRKVEKQLVVPDFLREILERSLLGTAHEYESTNEFDGSVGHLVWVNENGDVDDIEVTAASLQCGGVMHNYPPILNALKFKPGRIGKRKVRCQVAVSVHHTFEESPK